MGIEDGNLDSASSPDAGADATQDVTQAVSSPADDVTQGSSPDGAQTSVDGSDAGNDPNPKDPKELSEEDYQKEFQETVRKAAKADDGSAKTDKTDTSDDGDGKNAATDAKDKQADAGKDKDQQAADSDTDSDDPADYADTPFGKHPRFKKILSERKQFREQADTVRRELEQVKPDAEQYQKIDGFVKEYGIPQQEVAEAFRILALVKSDPAKARQAMAEHLARLDEFTGHKLPDDLLREVEEGRISEERARELSRARSETRRASQQTQATADQLKQEREARQREQADTQAQQSAAARQTAVREVETRLLAEDPDYKRLQPWVVRELKAQLATLPAEKRPQTPEQAVALFNAAVDAVRNDMRQTMPRKPEVRPTVTNAHGGASPSATRQPETMLDVVKQAAGQSTG